MAWNVPTNRETVVKKPSRSGVKAVAFAVAAAAVVGGVVAWLVLGGGDAEKKSVGKTRSGMIKEAKPNLRAQTEAAEKAPEPKFPGAPLDWDKPYPPQAYWPDGRLKQHSRYVKVITNMPSRASMSVEEFTFKCQADRDVAGMMLVEPGEMLIGEREFGEAFVERFLESLKTPIIIDDENDTPFQKELKASVIEMRKELKARHDAGENIAEVMNETRKQLQELGLYREEIKKMVREAQQEHGEEFTEQDEKDLISAANQMLEDRGCKPLRMPKMFIETVELQQDKE